MQRRGNILFIIIDALRARNLGCYGYSKPTSPNIDKIARGGVLFENAYSCINSTDPSLTTIFSGKYPLSHGIIGHAVFHVRTTPQEQIQEFNRTRIKLLPEVLRSSDYTTLAIDWLGRWHQRGYDYYSGLEDTATVHHIKYVPKKFTEALIILGRLRSHLLARQQDRLNATVLTNRAINLIKDNSSKDFFLFIHYWDTHTPYNPPKHYVKHIYEEAKGIEIKEILKDINNPEWRKYLHQCTKRVKATSEIIARYNGAIAFVDSEIGKLMEALDKYGLLDQTLVILTSDHGESLMEHGIFFDHHGLYEETIHVPLIFRYPKELPQNKRISAFVQHVDLAPTILDLLGIGVDNGFDGRSIIPLISNKVEQLRTAIYVEEAHTQRKRAIRTKDYKYICSLSRKDAICRYCGYTHGGVEELYDLNEDPTEILNIAEKRPKVLNELKKQLSDWVEYLEYKKSIGKKGRIEEKIEELKKLGKI